MVHQHRSVLFQNAALQSFIKRLHIGVVVQGPNAEIIACNQTALDLLGFTEDQLLGKTSFDPSWMAMDEKGVPLSGDQHPVPIAIRTKAPVRDFLMNVQRSCDPTGKADRVWLQISAEPTLDDDGNIVDVVCTFRDVTAQYLAEAAQKQAQADLQQERDLLRGILQTSATAVVMVNMQGQITFANRAAESVLRLSKNEITARSYDSFHWHHIDMQGNPLPIQEMPFVRVMQAQKPLFDMQHGIEDDEGHRFYLSINGAPVFDAAGQMTNIVFGINDITKNVAEQQELSQARNEAEEASRLKTQFLANMSHEMRTPLNGILGTSHLLSQTPLSQEQREHNDTIAHCSKMLLALINDILDISKIESNHFELEQAPFALRSVVDTVTLPFQHIAKQKSLYLQADIDSSLASFYQGDATRLTQLLTNLLANALKFTEKGGIFLRVSRDQDDQTGTSLLFTVKDSGIGIAPENLDKLFQPFVQADGTITRKYGGTGLGLSICRALVSRMGGRIWAQSMLGQGSQFYVSLPLSLPTPVPVPATADLVPADLPSIHASSHIPLQILLAEDNPINMKIVRRILEKMGHVVHPVCNGVQAVAATSEQHFDVIFMDMQMPEMDGLTATQQIRRRSLQALVHPYICALTANAQPADIQACIEAGMDAYLSKPVDIQKLRMLLSSVVQTRRVL